MPTSVLGSNERRQRGWAWPNRRQAAGFTLIELLIVIAIVAVSAGLMTLALRDSTASRLEEEGVRLSALLEMARAEARAAGVPVRWVPAADGSEQGFRFVGLAARPGSAGELPSHWLDRATRAQVEGGVFLVLGPEAILPPQRVLLRLGDQKLALASDGLGPFALVGSAAP
jgi:general secretion pathway protein H